MEALALLCNLHAEGPATVRRLHREGCDDLAALQRMRPEDLARTLGSTVAFARRFAAEGRILAQRSAGLLLEDEPSDAPPEATARAAETASIPVPVQHREAPVAIAVAPATITATNPVRPTVERGPAPILEIAAREGAYPLEPGLIDGLDEGWYGALRSAGITTLQELTEADDITTARRLGRPLTALMDLASCARRALEHEPALAIPSTRAPATHVLPGTSDTSDREPRLPSSSTAIREPAGSIGTLPGISSISAPIHSTEHLFPGTRSAAGADAGGPFA